jgi:hypothetical protein
MGSRVLNRATMVRSPSTTGVNLRGLAVGAAAYDFFHGGDK